MDVKIGFSRNNRWLSRTICTLTHSKVSHVYVRFPSVIQGIKYDILIHANGLEVMATLFENFSEHQTVVREFDYKIEDKKIDWLLHQLGKMYSYKLLLGFIYVLFFRIFGFKVKNPYADGDYTYVCSELIACLLDLPLSESITPQDLLDKLESEQKLTP